LYFLVFPPKTQRLDRRDKPDTRNQRIDESEIAISQA